MLFLGLVHWKKSWRWLCVCVKMAVCMHAHTIPSDNHGAGPFKAYISDTYYDKGDLQSPLPPPHILANGHNCQFYFTQKPQELVVSGKHNYPGTTYHFFFLIQTLSSEDVSVLLFSVFCWQLAAHLFSVDQKAHPIGHNSEAAWRVPGGWAWLCHTWSFCWCGLMFTALPLIVGIRTWRCINVTWLHGAAVSSPADHRNSRTKWGETA